MVSMRARSSWGKRVVVRTVEGWGVLVVGWGFWEKGGKGGLAVDLGAEESCVGCCGGGLV